MVKNKREWEDKDLGRTKHKQKYQKYWKHEAISDVKTKKFVIGSILVEWYKVEKFLWGCFASHVHKEWGAPLSMKSQISRPHMRVLLNGFTLKTGFLHKLSLKKIIAEVIQ